MAFSENGSPVHHALCAHGLPKYPPLLEFHVEHARYIAVGSHAALVAQEGAAQAEDLLEIFRVVGRHPSRIRHVFHGRLYQLRGEGRMGGENIRPHK